MNVARPTHFRLALVLAFAAALLLPSLAEGAIYKSSREGFRITFQVRGDYIRNVEIEARVRCGPDGSSYDRTTFDRAKRIRADGSFRFYRRVATSAVFVRSVLVGKVRGRRIYGRFRSRESDDFTSCGTGTRDDPWIHFVARRAS